MSEQSAMKNLLMILPVLVALAIERRRVIQLATSRLRRVR
jgi:hypothetical protein